MSKAFVFGKFLPFHKGHEAMIRFALTQTDFLSVLICCSDKEGVPVDIRLKWMQEAFHGIENLELKLYSYSEDEFPNTSVTSLEVSKIWAGIFKAIYPDVTTLVTSEPYGDLVASLMKIDHIPFDIDRKLFPVSASKISADLFSYWQFLPDSVKDYYAIKVVILGTESTGKTTLTENLSTYYNCACVLEAARDIISDSTSFAYEDLYLVAKEHARRIKEITLAKGPLVIIDTDIHITKSYSRFVFDRELDVSEEIYTNNKAALYLYLVNDVSFVQDGTRLSEIDRNRLDVFHRQVMTDHDISIKEIEGNWHNRLVESIDQIDKMLNTLRRL